MLDVIQKFYLITISNHLIINNVLYEKLFKIFRNKENNCKYILIKYIIIWRYNVDKNFLKNLIVKLIIKLTLKKNSLFF